MSCAWVPQYDKFQKTPHHQWCVPRRTVDCGTTQEGGDYAQFLSRPDPSWSVISSAALTSSLGGVLVRFPYVPYSLSMDSRDSGEGWVAKMVRVYCAWVVYIYLRRTRQQISFNSHERTYVLLRQH